MNELYTRLSKLIKDNCGGLRVFYSRHDGSRLVGETVYLC